MRWFFRVMMVFSLLTAVAWADDMPSDLTLVTNKHDIKIWTYQVPNVDVSGFKATVTVKSTLSGLVGLITDADNAKRWLYRTKSVEILEQDDNRRHFTIRAISNFPWPFKDREVLMDVRVSQDPKTGIVRIDNTESAKFAKYPVQEGCLRMPVMKGYWQLKPIAHGQVEVTMTGYAHPGGNVPTGIVNLLIQEHPYNTLQGLRRVIGDAKYQKMQYPTITELTNGAN